MFRIYIAIIAKTTPIIVVNSIFSSKKIVLEKQPEKDSKTEIAVTPKVAVSVEKAPEEVIIEAANTEKKQNQNPQKKNNTKAP